MEESEMTLNRKITYSIGDTANMTGVTQKQIRNWEAKGYIPQADRVVSGERAYRRFTLNQVELISSIKNYLDEGFTLSAAVKKAETNYGKGGDTYA
jgi:DNA-binding transcriptional MerR regulator